MLFQLGLTTSELKQEIGNQNTCGLGIDNVLRGDLKCDLDYQQKILLHDNDWTEICKEWQNGREKRMLWQIEQILDAYLVKDAGKLSMKEFSQTLFEVSRNKKALYQLNKNELLSTRILQELILCEDEELQLRLMFSGWSLNTGGKVSTCYI